MKTYLKNFLFFVLFVFIYSCNPETIPDQTQDIEQEEMLPTANGDDEYTEIDDKD